MSGKYWREKQVLIAKETEYGTDAVPTPALNAIRTFEFSFDPFEAENITVEEDKPKPGSDAETLVGRHGVVRFQTYLASAGSAGDIPPLDPLFGACGYEGEPDDPDPLLATLVEYTQVFPAEDSVSIYVDISGVLHKFVGGRGTFEITSEKRNFPRIAWTFTGLFVPVVVSALDLSTVDTSAWLKALPFRAALVDVEMYGETIACHRFAVTSGETVEFYEHSVAEEIDISDRKSRFSMRLEEPDITEFDIWAKITADPPELGALKYVHGIEAGQIVEINASQAQATSPSKNDEQGRTALDIEGPLVANSSNQFKALSITFR